MGQIQIEVFQFALVVGHDGGATVLYPAIGHVLMIEQDGRVIPVQRGADLEVCGPGGAKLPSTTTDKTDDYRRFVVNVRAAEDNPGLSVPSALLDPSAAQDPARINGRLFLKGGMLTARQASDPNWRKPYVFKGGTFLVTDTAVFTLPVPDGETFVLSVNSRPIPLPDGSSTRIANRDVIPGDKRGFEELDEFVRLCEVLGHAATLPTAGGGSIHPMGIETICLIGDF